MTKPEDLANTDYALLTAPAGCGKTEIICQAIAYAEGKQLILTHTHAGVQSVRERLKKLNIPSAKYEVDTIASWALRYSASYPQLSGIDLTKLPPEDWNDVYTATLKLITFTAIQCVIQHSYDGIYVDEYQDCNLLQNDLVISLSQLLPCKLVGDELQGIFDFKDSVVSFERDVPNSFVRLPELTTPWRWHNTNPALGEWLLSIRSPIQTGGTIDFNASPAILWDIDYEEKIKGMYKLSYSLPREESIVGLYYIRTQCYPFSSRTNGFFNSIEELECEELLKFAREIQASQGFTMANLALNLASKCFVRFKTEFSSILGPVPFSRVFLLSQKNRHQWNDQKSANCQIFMN